MPPLDHIFQEAWQIALSQYTTRVFCIPPAQGIAEAKKPDLYREFVLIR